MCPQFDSGRYHNKRVSEVFPLGFFFTVDHWLLTIDLVDGTVTLMQNLKSRLKRHGTLYEVNGQKSTVKS